jgi:hypothetical protein
MDPATDLNVFISFERLIRVSPETGITLLVAFLLFVMVLYYRIYTDRDPIAAYMPDVVALSVSALVSAFVAVGVAGESILKGNTSGSSEPIHPLVEWGGVLVSGGVIAMVFWFLSLRFRQFVSARKRDDLIACTLGWVLIELGSKKVLRERFRRTASQTLNGDAWNEHYFEQELRCGLKRIESRKCTSYDIQDLETLEKHSSSERAIVGEFSHILINTLHIVAAYLLFAMATAALLEILQWGS